MADTAPLIDPSALHARLADPTLRLADTRWYLDDPKQGRAAYAAGHLPGALHIDLEEQLSAPPGEGRHPLPEPTHFATTMGGLGFGDEHTIVGYDDRGGVVAARLWWMLRWIGHEQVCVLDGGLGAWQAAGLPLTTGVPALPPATLTVRRGTTRSIDRAALGLLLGEVVLLDARAPERYLGEVEPVDPVAGHIPTARTAPTDGNLGDDGRFLPPADLAERYRALGAGEADVVVYCGSGVFACHDILAMRLAGLPEPRLYPGSWSDWCRAGGPAVTGPEPGAA